MKPFELQKALTGEKVITREGKNVTQLTLFDVNNQFLLAAVIDGELCKFLEDGKINSSGVESHHDLFMAEPEIWVNVYHSKVRDDKWCSRFYESEKEAKENIIEGNYQTTIKLKL